MEILVIIAITAFLITMICLVIMVGKLIFDTSGNKHGETVYLLKVTPNGSIKVKKYRGKVKYWNDVNIND